MATADLLPLSRWRVFCPRAACQYEVVASDESRRSITRVIERPCPDCRKYGLDALELGT